MKSNQTGTALILAWPETYCKQAGGWYDDLLFRLKISKHRYYKVGHAAVVLIDHQSSVCHYFDFGRYHAPFGYGRVRSAETDHELNLRTNAHFNENGEVSNLEEILQEIVHKEECHGTGSLHSGTFSINFESAFLSAKQMEAISPIPYGPFLINGSNCSRFVRSVMLAGCLSIFKRVRLKIPFTISPTPLGNIRSVENYKIVRPNYEINSFKPKPQNKSFYLKTLDAPKRPNNLFDKAHWLAGEGGGSWFDIEVCTGFLRVRKFSPTGKKESDGIFSNDIDFDIMSSYDITYPTNSNILSIEQNDRKFFFSFLEHHASFIQKSNLTLQYA